MSIDTSRPDERRERSGHHPPDPRRESRSGVAVATPARIAGGSARARSRAFPGGREQLADAVAERFRMPAAGDPAPESRHLVGVCAWAAALGLGGVAVAVRALVGFITINAAWYGPTIVFVGLVGLVCTIGAFASVHRHRLPWLMLSAATVALIMGWFVTGAA